MTPYSLTEHLAKSIWFSRWQEGWIGVFSAYFDASGDETDKRTKFVSVAGFIASAPVWNDFENKWLQRLRDDAVFDEHGYPAFHMVDCANYRYAFDGWREKESKRQHLLQDLAALLSDLGRKECCVIDVEQYKALIEADLKERFSLTVAYVLGGRACAARVKEWCFIDQSPQLSKVQFFFEHGDGDDIQLDLRFRLLDDEYPEPNFKRKRNRYKNGELIEYGLVPFQAADVLAYLTCLDAKFAGRDWRDKENIRWMLDELAPIPEPTVQLTEGLLRGLNDYLRVSTVSLLREGDS